jgi:hypothetical protein
MVGGGVRGKDVGIAHDTTTQVGPTIETFHLFIEGYHQVGGTTIGSIVGEGINGTTNEYPTNKSNGTGATGKRADIGRSKILGVSKVWSPEHDHNIRHKLSNHNNRDHNPEGSSHSIHSHNTGRHHNNHDRNPERSNNSTHSHSTGRNHNNLNLDMESLKEGRKKNMIEGRVTKRLSHYEKLPSIKYIGYSKKTIWRYK